MKKSAVLLAVLLLLSGCCSPAPAETAAPAETVPTTVVTEPAILPAEPETTAPPVPMDVVLSEYKVVRPDSWNKDSVASGLAFKKSIEDAIGSRMSYSSDIVPGGVITDEITATKEILLGATNRPESAMAIDGVQGGSFVIAVINNKLVINSPLADYTFEGMNYFINNYLSAAVNGVLSLTTTHRYMSEPVTDLYLSKNGETFYRIVYRDGLDDYLKPNDKKDGIDLEVELAQSIQNKFSSFLNTNISVTTDKDTDISREILIGATDRSETVQFLNGLAYDEYGFGVVNGKVVVAGWNITSTQLAVEKFENFIKTRNVKNDDGTYTLVIDASEKKTFTNKKSQWIIDIPTYDGGTVKGTADAGSNDFQFYITDTTLAEYDAYCAKLAANGYTCQMTTVKSGNKFALYTGTSSDIYVYYIDAYKAVRIITSDPDTRYPEHFVQNGAPSYTKITNSTITQMELDYAAESFGMCYIITLEDGSFIVYDGGLGYGQDAAKLYSTLKSLNKRSDGKIVISAWMLTHEHSDHFNTFAKFCKTYGGGGSKVQVKAAYVNYSGPANHSNAYNPSTLISGGSNYTDISAAVGGMDLITVRTGMEFYICNVKMEVLYTEEDVYPNVLNFFNDTSVVTRATISGQTFVFLGDVRYVGSAVLCDMYGKDLKADFVQVSHHGWDGGTVDLYANIDPVAAFWPGNAGEFISQYSAGGTTQAVSRFLRDKSNCKDFWNQSQTTTLTLPFKHGDPVKVS